MLPSSLFGLRTPFTTRILAKQELKKPEYDNQTYFLVSNRKTDSSNPKQKSYLTDYCIITNPKRTDFKVNDVVYLTSIKPGFSKKCNLPVAKSTSSNTNEYLKLDDLNLLEAGHKVVSSNNNYRSWMKKNKIC